MAANPSFPHIETTGYGEVIAQPDMAEFTVQIEESTLTAEQAKKRVDKVVTAFIQRLMAEGVQKQDINSSNLYLSPRYHYPKSGASELVGYKASRSITVTVNDLTKLNAYLDGAIGDGINRVDNIQLKVKDKKSYQQLARKEAIKDANDKASSLAEGFSSQLDGVWKITYNQGPERRPIMYKSMAMEAQADVAASYQDATIIIRDSVNVTYRLK
ncbi:oxidative stress defense protein [Vibrio sp. MACH09]|nr:oxidative stress defense protein [Vibrio sp. MACH09]